MCLTKPQRLTLTLAACSLLFGIAGESRAEDPRFEVASVKPAAPGPRFGIRLKESPGRIHYVSASLRELILRAYRRKDYQVETPGWMNSELFDIDATYPLEAESQVPQMLSALLAERFKLRVRLIDKSVKALALRVRSGGGAVLKPASEPGRGGVAFNLDRFNAYQATMDNLSDLLSHLLTTPVVDETGLTERYTFELKMPPETSATGQPASADSSAIIASLKEIGLTLVSTTVTDKFVIVDGAERLPVEN